MIRLGIIGYGYWGPNILRNFSSIPSATVIWVCDINPKTTTAVTRQYPNTKVTARVSDLMSDPSCDAIVIVTPISTHYSLAKQALLAGKHVLVEKPMTMTSKESEELVALAKKQKKILMVDHTFIYTPAVSKIKSIIEKKTLGDIFYIDCVRTNLGLLQKDSNVLYDLAAHDFSIIDYCLGVSPFSISTTGFALKKSPQVAVSYLTAVYPKDLYVHAQVSWISPVKIRRITFVGTKKMLVYDDMEPTEKIKLYDKSISVQSDPKAWQQLRVGYRIGTTIAPHVEVVEGLSGMTRAFIKSIRTHKLPVSDGNQGTRIVNILEAATRSLASDGKAMLLSNS